ncbi:hypothetical protein EJB05_29237, partial [Eragrostis curvula]
CLVTKALPGPYGSTRPAHKRILNRPCPSLWFPNHRKRKKTCRLQTPEPWSSRRHSHGDPLAAGRRSRPSTSRTPPPPRPSHPSPLRLLLLESATRRKHRQPRLDSLFGIRLRPPPLNFVELLRRLVPASTAPPHSAFRASSSLQNLTMGDNREWMYSGWKRGRPSSDEWELRKRGQEARFTNEDYAQQRGGSLPFPTIQQNLEYRFGPEKAGGLDTYKVQMAGFKASLSGSGKTLSKKVQKRIVDYSQAMEKEYGEEWEKRNELDGTVMYQTFDGLKHGRFPMGNGSLKKAEVLATVKHKRTRYSGSSYQAMQRQNEELQQKVAELRERDARREQMMQHQQDLLKALCQKVNIDIPPTILTSWESQQARTSESRIDDSNNSEQEGPIEDIETAVYAYPQDGLDSDRRVELS